MHWSEVRHLPNTYDEMLLGRDGGGGPSSSSPTPQIKNHSVTHHRGNLYCFGGYDGRRNHQTLLIYSLKEQRWITPSSSSGLITEETGHGLYHDGSDNDNFSGNNSIKDFDNSRSNNSNPTQCYTVRGAPPPGRNGHTATLATATRRRRRLRCQQQLKQQQHRAAAMLLDHTLHPGDDAKDAMVNNNALRDGNNNNNISSGILMDTALNNPNPESSQHQQHFQQHQWPPHPPAKANGLGALTITDVAKAVGDVVDAKMNESDATTTNTTTTTTTTTTTKSNDDDCRKVIEKVLREAMNNGGNDCYQNTANVVDETNCHQGKQQEPEKKQMVNDDASSSHYRLKHIEDELRPPSSINERVIANDINPMEDDEYDNDKNSNNDDEDDAQIIIIGGWLGEGPFAASDMWVLDISGGLDRLRWFQPQTLGTPPGPCNMHSADFIPSRGEVYVFRGGNGREYLNDLHALDVETYFWRKVQTHGTPPQQRANHSSALLEDKNRRRTIPTTGPTTATTTSHFTGGGRSQLFIFGGWNGSERLNDIHILDTDTSTWSTPRVSGVKPHPRAGMTLTALRGRVYLFGGSGTSSKCFDDLQVLDCKDMAWLDVNEGNGTGVEGMPQSLNASNGSRKQLISHGHCSSLLSYYDNGWEVSDFGEGENGGGCRSATNKIQKSSPWDLPGGQDAYARSSESYYPLVYSANPNDEDSTPSVYVSGKPPGRRAGHSATAVAGRFIYIFGGSCGTDYLNDFFVLDTDPPPLMKVTESPSPQLYASRLRHFCNDEEFSDVTFFVEGRKVFGHKLVLSTISDCFRAMFMAGFRESASNKTEIQIPNCSYDSFLSMMEYIYTGQSPQDIITLSSDGIDRAISLLELADQFFLYHLKQRIEVVLQPAVNEETCPFLLQVAQKTNASQLESYCRYYERNMDNYS